MTQKTLDETVLQRWVGKSETKTDTLHPGQACLMQATMDRAPTLKTGDALPPLWHWLYFHTGVPLSGLGRDGHPALGDFLPPVDLPRRMWAGGRLAFSMPIALGETLIKTSTVQDVTLKSGRSGTLCFVTVSHVLAGADGKERLREEHDIVYREDPSSNPDTAAQQPKPAQAPAQSKNSETITPSTVQLFRYSALTFNSHRIHYDRDYCRDVEGYPGIIFHGPLTATLLADFAVRQSGGKPLSAFSFRAVAPLFDLDPFTLHWDGGNSVWAQTPQGNLAMKADFETA